MDTTFYKYIAPLLNDNIFLGICNANADIQLSVTLQQLFLEEYYADKLPQLPNTLTGLYIINQGVALQIEALPPQLRTLVIAGNQIDTLPPLPPTLRLLRVNTTSPLRILPDELNELICNNPPKRLPKSLKCLELQSNLNNIPLLQEGLVTLKLGQWFNPYPKSSIQEFIMPTLPKSIQQLYMYSSRPDSIRLAPSTKLELFSCLACTEAHLKQIPTEHLKKIYVKLPCLPPAFERIDRAGTPICK